MLMETKVSGLLRQLADATDTAEAFRSYVVLAGGGPSETDLFSGHFSAAVGEMHEEIRAYAQAKLDAKVESLNAELLVAVGGEPVPAPVEAASQPDPLKNDPTGNEPKAVAPKTARRKPAKRSRR